MIDVLIPTWERPAALAVTLTALCFQSRMPDRILVADQGGVPSCESAEVRAVAALLRDRGVEVVFLRNLPRRGLAQQRQFLLDHSIAPHVLFLDDDVIMESWLLATLSRMLSVNACGFIGSAVLGLSWVDDVRPHEQAIEFWGTPPTAEVVAPGGAAWTRHRLHNAANLLHVQRQLAVTPEKALLYKIAWVGGCVLYDRNKLLQAGGFNFWRDLPSEHAGEDVYAQQRVMARFGGAGLLPSGAYHLELATTVQNREYDVPHRLGLPMLAVGS